jgi:hypothetical protein
VTYEPNIYFVEIALTYVCNVRCANCCTLSTQAKTTRQEDLSLDQIKQFVEESVAANHRWQWIKLHGGEPTLHPNFIEVCEVLAAYKRDHNPGVRLSVCSNGSNPKKVEAALALGFDPQVSVKVGVNKDASGNMIDYVRVNESPKDLGLSASSGCYIARDCGIGFNHQGFWPCAPCAGAARVFDYAPPVEHVADLTADRLKKLYSHCDHCGFAVSRPRSVSQVTSPTWESKLVAYNAKSRSSHSSPHPE